MSDITQKDFDSRFVEQAEYIPTSNFLEWSSSHPNETSIIKKLTQSGAKVLTGPRGCGKTTLLLKSYNKLSSQGKRGALPVYVNFKSSLKIEPVYKNKANGGYWFSQWMYLKVYSGLYSSLSDLGITEIDSLQIGCSETKKYIDQLELGQISKVQDLELSVSQLEEDIEIAMNVLGKTRCVLFLDDAAHAFSPGQQKDFFEFFRKIKSRTISPKAAIYPGVTSFAPTFHLGHDAEEIPAWVDPEGDTYFTFMTSMLEARLPQEVFEKLKSEHSLLTIMCYASFGIPRVLLNMVRNVYEETDEEGVYSYETKFTKKNVMNQVKRAYRDTYSVYRSLQDKLPIYSNYINKGFDIYSDIIDLIKSYNKGKELVGKSVTIALRKEVNSEVKKIFGFFQYAGLVSPKKGKEVSKGEKGVFELYLVNLAALVDSNAILASKGVKADDLATALESRDAHEFTRTNSEYFTSKFLKEVELSMPPCSNCQAERVSEEARFCSNCGSQLTQNSLYLELTKKGIDVLPLTATRVASIVGSSQIRTIGDVLYDIGHEELRSVEGVGSFWASKIYYLAEEYMS